MILPYGAARGSPSRNLVRARTSRRPPARRCLRPSSRPVSLPHAPTTEKDQFRSQDEGNRVARRRRPARRAAPTVRAQLRHGHAMSSRPPASIPPRGTAKADAPSRLSLYDSLSVGVAPAASPPPHSPACARPLPSKRAPPNSGTQRTATATCARGLGGASAEHAGSDRKFAADGTYGRLLAERPRCRFVLRVSDPGRTKLQRNRCFFGG